MNTHRHRIMLVMSCLVAVACGGSDSTQAPESTLVSSMAPSTSQPPTTPSPTTMPLTTTSLTTEPPTTDSSTTETIPSEPAVEESSTTVTTAPEPATAVALDSGGLILVDRETGSTTMVTFGTPLSATLAAVRSALGPPDTVSVGNAECGNGQASVALWPAVLSIDFDERDQFLSWTLQTGSPLTTLTGFGLGSMIGDLEAGQEVTIQESTLGNEFYVEADGPGFGGLLDGDRATATVSDLWAGPICAFR